MTVGARGHLHEAGFYASDAQFRALIQPFIEAGIAAGDPVVIGYDERKSDLLRGWFDDAPQLTYIADAALYATPARAIESYRRLFAEHVEAGACRVRIAGDVPHPGNGRTFHGWDRYESAVNTVWENYPVQSLCLYDARTVPPQVRDVVERTHRHLLSPSGQRRVSERFQDPASFVPLPAEMDVLEALAPDVDLADPTPAQARRALERLCRGRLDEDTFDELRIGVSEAVANAALHGQAPRRLRMWADELRAVVLVCDGGLGPADPLAGLAPAPPSDTGAGLGLWLSCQLNLDVSLIRRFDGFTVRLRTELPPAAM